MADRACTHACIAVVYTSSVSLAFTPDLIHAGAQLMCGVHFSTLWQPQMHGWQPQKPTASWDFVRTLSLTSVLQRFGQMGKCLLTCAIRQGFVCDRVKGHDQVAHELCTQIAFDAQATFHGEQT